MTAVRDAFRQSSACGRRNTRSGFLAIVEKVQSAGHSVQDKQASISVPLPYLSRLPGCGRVNPGYLSIRIFVSRGVTTL